MSESDPPFDEPVVLPPEDVLDLHPFQPKDIPSVVEEYLEDCQRSGGAGVQRAIIRSLLEKHPAVLSFEDAPAEAGSWGATIISLLVD